MSDSIVIVGGGAIGCSIAHFLAAQKGTASNIIVVERDTTYRIASSSLSASSIRQQFSTPINIQLSQFGYEFMSNADRNYSSHMSGISLTPSGYLFLARADQESELRTRTELARALGASLEEYSAKELSSKFHWLNANDLSYGVRGLQGEGWFDGYGLMQFYRSRARSAGVTFITGDVCDFEQKNGRIEAVRLTDGRQLHASSVVNACGAWAGNLASKIGVDLPIRARRRTMFVVSCPDKDLDLPILVDASGVYVRPEQNHFLCTTSPKPENDHDDMTLDPDFTLFEDIIWPTLAERIPAFEALRVERAWAGYYEFNTVDHNGIVGRTNVENFFVAAGFSGHGLMHSAGVGRGMAELLTFGEYRSLDLSILSPKRFAEGKLIVEDGIY